MKIRLIIFLLCFVCLASPAREVSELYSLARENIRNGQLPKALDCYEEIFEILPDKSIFDIDRLTYARPYTNLLLLAGRYGEVEKMLSQPLYAGDTVLQINKAAALGYQGKYEEAEAILDRLLQGDISPGLTGRIYQNKGYMAIERKDYAAARSNLENATECLQDLDKAIARSNLALATAYCGQTDEALRIIDQALDEIKTDGLASHRDYIKALRKKAEILQIKGAAKKAAAVYREYFQLERDWLAENLPKMGKNARLDLWQSEKELLSKCFSLESDAEFLYEVAMFRRLTSLLGIQDQQKLSSLLKITPRSLKNRLASHDVALEFINYEDLDGTRKYAAILLPKSGSPDFITLFDEEFLYEPIEFEGHEPQSVVSLVQADKSAYKNLLYNSEELGNKVWGKIISRLPSGTKRIYFAPEGILHLWGIENMPFDGKEGLELRRVTSTALLSQKTGATSGQPNTLIIGGLDYTTLPSGAEDSDCNHDAARLLAERVGKVDVFNYLPGTRSEADSIKSISRNAILRHQQAEENLKVEMPEFYIIHIATHGYTLDVGVKRKNNPELDHFVMDEFTCLVDTAGFDRSLLACGIALSGANVASAHPDREDGLLSAREICDLDLSGVEFVVLSACQTAQGSVVDEGAAGLIRGLKNAGVKTVMASLWSVDDTSTMLFMTEFYRQLNAGRSKYEAYCRAQQHLRESVSTVHKKKFSPKTLAFEKDTKTIEIKYDDPYFWAPFILIDDF